MAQQFCHQCGARLLQAARFCVECGGRLNGGAPARRSLSLERYAPAVVLAAVSIVVMTAVSLGVLNQPPPNLPLGRGPGGQPSLPEGHPPISLPDDMRALIAKMVESAKSEPDNLEAWSDLASIQYRAAQIIPSYLDAAAASYRHILDRDPRNSDALHALGNISYDQRDAPAAIEYYRRYLAIKPDDKGVRTDLGTMLLASQQIEAAIEQYEAVLEVDPRFFQAQFNLAIAHRQGGDSEMARAAIESAREMATDEEMLARVDGLQASLNESAGAASAAGASAADVRAGVESIFRSHPIVGPRLERIDWPTERSVRVLLREFPLDGMPVDAREKFVERIRAGLRANKARDGSGAAFEVELVDVATGRVMETVVE